MDIQTLLYIQTAALIILDLLVLAFFLMEKGWLDKNG